MLKCFNTHVLDVDNMQLSVAAVCGWIKIFMERYLQAINYDIDDTFSKPDIMGWK